MTECRLCSQSIHFDRNIISEKTGKLIPLQEGSDDPHSCAEWKAQHRKYYHCKNCNAEVYFDDLYKSKNDKFIPLNKETGEPHQCDK